MLIIMVTSNNSILELERYLSPAEVAAFYGIQSRVTLWRWRKEGRLPEPDLNRGSFQRWKVRSLIEFDQSQQELDQKSRNGSEGKSLLSRLGLS